MGELFLKHPMHLGQKIVSKFDLTLIVVSEHYL
jgi:hypothetical protein